MIRKLLPTALILTCTLLFLGATVCNLRYFVWYSEAYRDEIGCHAIVPDAWPRDFDVIPERVDINSQLATLEYVTDKGKYGLIVLRSVPKVVALTYRLTGQERVWFLPDEGGYPHEIDELALIIYLNREYYDNREGAPFRWGGEDV